jgi:hypothetical protein
LFEAGEEDGEDDPDFGEDVEEFFSADPSDDGGAEDDACDEFAEEARQAYFFE